MAFSPTNRTKSLRIATRMLATLALALTIGAVATPAKAEWVQPHGHGHAPAWHNRGWNEHARVAASWHHAHPVYVPGYVAAPPPVVYYPPPQSTGLNLILPIHIN